MAFSLVYQGFASLKLVNLGIYFVPDALTVKIFGGYMDVGVLRDWVNFCSRIILRIELNIVIGIRKIS